MIKTNVKQIKCAVRAHRVRRLLMWWVSDVTSQNEKVSAAEQRGTFSFRLTEFAASKQRIRASEREICCEQTRQLASNYKWGGGKKRNTMHDGTGWLLGVKIIQCAYYRLPRLFSSLSTCAAFLKVRSPQNGSDNLQKRMISFVSRRASATTRRPETRLARHQR